jgi:DNA-binding CsgD family transcriptional regulator
MPQIDDTAEGTRAGLTNRQLACLEGVGQHMSAKEIGRELGISNHAVEKHLKAARNKLGASSTIEALRIYREGTVKPQYASSELPSTYPMKHPPGAGSVDDAALFSFVGQPRRFWETDVELTRQQTLVAIGLTVMSIIIAIAVLLAFAQGAHTVWPWR